MGFRALGSEFYFFLNKRAFLLVGAFETVKPTAHRVPAFAAKGGSDVTPAAGSPTVCEVTCTDGVVGKAFGLLALIAARQATKHIYRPLGGGLPGSR